MRTVLIEIRDRGTFIPAMATLVVVNDQDEHYLLRRAGWGAGSEIVYLFRADSCLGGWDPLTWGNTNRTMMVSHYALYGREHPEIDPARVVPLRDVQHGFVLDVQYLLGETAEPKQSERVETPYQC